MKIYILLDKNNIVRCQATNPDNLHLDWSGDKYPTMLRVDAGGICGDEYDPKTMQWTARPENYPKPSDEDLIEIEIKKIQLQRDRVEAIQNLKQRVELPADFKES